MPKMGLMLMKLLEFCQEVIILKCENYLTHPFVPLCIEAYPQSQEATVLPDYYIEISPGNLYIIFYSIEL